MKTFIVFILFSTYALSQNFFPLEIGNKYLMTEYLYVSGPHGNYNISLRGYKVLKDSIISGKQFFSFSQTKSQFFKQDYFYHYDSIEQIILVKLPGDDTIRTAVDFNIPAGEWFTSYINGNARQFKSYGKEYLYNEGDSILSFKISSSMGYIEKSTYIFADNLGLFYFSDSSVQGPDLVIYKDTLKSAVLDSFVFNPVILNVTSLSPLINRPENTFPFTMQSSYYTNLSFQGKDLVDSFYVELLLTRENDTQGIYGNI